MGVGKAGPGSGARFRSAGRGGDRARPWDVPGGAVKAYIVSVGGFLGMGKRYVAIDPKAIALTRQDEKDWKATINANKDQIRAAPEYKWDSNWRKP